MNNFIYVKTLTELYFYEGIFFKNVIFKFIIFSKGDVQYVLRNIITEKTSLFFSNADYKVLIIEPID